jgi:oligoribonuclease (3'-5' exoribonuclease)
MQYFLHGDLETGGLNGRIENGKLGMEYYPIFELAFIVTDLNLEQVGEPLRLVIHHNDDDINKSHEWAIKTHTESGLLNEVRLSTLTLEQAEQRIIEHLKALGIESYDSKEKTGAAFSGNSIMFDRSYIMCQMPKLHEYLHYRQLDISALALAARAFKPELEKEITSKKQYKHEALADIRESIAELKMYRSALFRIT